MTRILADLAAGRDRGAAAVNLSLMGMLLAVAGLATATLFG
jgi:hypothetical protein